MAACQTFTTEFLSGQLGPIVLDMSWFAVKTRSRFEKKVALELQEKGVETFLPLHSMKRQWSDRRQTVSMPLFSGYAFVRIASDQATRIRVLQTNGVVSFVGTTRTGTPIPDDQIEAIRQLLKQQIPFCLHPYVKIGQTVRIRGGALDGIKGILMKANGDQSLIVSVELIQRSVAMRVTGYEIEPA